MANPIIRVRGYIELRDGVASEVEDVLDALETRDRTTVDDTAAFRAEVDDPWRTYINQGTIPVGRLFVQILYQGRESGLGGR